MYEFWNGGRKIDQFCLKNFEISLFKKKLIFFILLRNLYKTKLSFSFMFYLKEVKITTKLYYSFSIPSTKNHLPNKNLKFLKYFLKKFYDLFTISFMFI